MPEGIPAGMSQAAQYLQACQTVMEALALPETERQFVDTRVNNARCYLRKELTPYTEAMDNWQRPENQVMMRRFITHIAHEMRMFVADCQPADDDARQRRLWQHLETLIAGLEGLGHGLPEGTQMSGQRPPAQTTVQITNEQVIVTEWRFAPGAETGWHRHGFDYVVVPQTTGELFLETTEGETRAQLVAGQSYFRYAGVEHNVVNANAYEFVFVEVELKPAEGAVKG